MIIKNKNNFVYTGFIDPKTKQPFYILMYKNKNKGMWIINKRPLTDTITNDSFISLTNLKVIISNMDKMSAENAYDLILKRYNSSNKIKIKNKVKNKITHYMGGVYTKTGNVYYIAVHRDGKMIALDGGYRIDNNLNLLNGIKVVFPKMNRMPISQAKKLIRNEYWCVPKTINNKPFALNLNKVTDENAYSIRYKHTTYKYPNKTNIKENNMLNTINTRTAYLINEQDISEMSFDKMIAIIVELENNINSLKAISIKSKAITAKIKEQKKMMKFVVKHLDVQH